MFWLLVVIIMGWYVNNRGNYYNNYILFTKVDL